MPQWCSGNTLVCQSKVYGSNPGWGRLHNWHPNSMVVDVRLEEAKSIRLGLTKDRLPSQEKSNRRWCKELASTSLIQMRYEESCSGVEVAQCFENQRALFQILLQWRPYGYYVKQKYLILQTCRMTFHWYFHI